jgi:uncharacterized protein
MADDEAPQGGDHPEPASQAPGARPAPIALRPLAIGLISICAVLAVLMLAVAILGSASDGSPTVSIRLSSSMRNANPGSGTRAASFLASRSISGHLVADPELIEDSFEGPLPRRAANGREPMSAYAMPIDRNDRRPKIAIVIGGLGVGAAATDLALNTLPPQITLGFVPYAQNLQSNADRARGTGHELLLQVPMEPFDFPNSDPGPHALLVSAAADENIRRFRWAMSRFTGYAGFSNLLGARFLGEAGAIEPVLAEGAKRGILFFDTGASARSLAGTAARHVSAAIATGTLTLDEVQSAAAIDNKLVQLEAQARADGFAIGVGSSYPVTIDRVARWAESAGSRGLLAVPVSALAAKPGASASASSR